jgi:Zn-dependent peptidase ImmA (M78 family)
MCKELERAFESRRRNYIAARFAAYYRVSTELAAYKNVEMERAKSDWKSTSRYAFSPHRD